MFEEKKEEEKKRGLDVKVWVELVTRTRARALLDVKNEILRQTKKATTKDLQAILKRLESGEVPRGVTLEEVSRAKEFLKWLIDQRLSARRTDN